MSNQRFRNVVFTINNPTDDDYKMMEISEDITYIIYGEEIGKEGTPHLQGYAELSKQFNLSKVKKLLGSRAHIEKRMGNQTSAIEYCKKDGKFTEKGTPSKQGKRNDLQALRKQVTDGVTQIEVIAQCANFQQIRYTEKLFEYKPLSPEYKKRTVYWYWGATGLGKTRAAYEMVKQQNKDFWRSNLGGSQWFNGYWGQPIAILDEVRAKNWPYSTMLELLDGYEIRIPYKGGFCVWNPEIVIITAPKKPQDTYEGQLQFGDGHIDQLLRRITEVKEFTELFPVTVTPFKEPVVEKRTRHEDEQEKIYTDGICKIHQRFFCQICS